MLHVRIDKDLKAQAAEALAAMGLSTSDAVRLLFHRIVADQAFPL
jgi:DNA-damage-inducible protein J